MESKIAASLKMKFQPVGIVLTEQRPETALQFAKGRWGCVISMLAASAKGKTAVFDRETFGCMGGGVGLGFGNLYDRWPGGLDAFCHFLSIGNAANVPEDKAKALAEKLSGRLSREGLENFLYGERYVKSPALVKKFVEGLPIMDLPQKYVALKPLAGIDPDKEKPEVVVFVVNPDQLSALTVLYNYDTESDRTGNVIAPGGAGCQQIGIIPFREARSEHPRAVIGLTDVSARNTVKKSLGHDALTFTVSFPMFLRMEANVEGSFLQRHSWKELNEG